MYNYNINYGGVYYGETFTKRRADQNTNIIRCRQINRVRSQFISIDTEVQYIGGMNRTDVQIEKYNSDTYNRSLEQTWCVIIIIEVPSKKQ
jgi:hypothetical protein